MATTKELITQLYIGYFNRAPDPEGLAYWIEDVDVRGQSIEAVSGLFTTSPEAIALYPYLAFPTLTSPDAFLTALYQNLFNRAIDPDGLAYYKAKLEAGVATGDVLADILANARTNEGSEDQALLANKTEVGVYWAEQAASTPGFSYNDAAQSSARNSLTNVTTDEASVEAAKAQSDSFFETIDSNAGQTFTLTTGIDAGAAFTGGAGNDTFFGTENTLTSGDALDGGDGVDTLRYASSGTVAVNEAGFTAKSIEKVEITADAVGGTNFDVSGVTDVETITNVNSSGALNIVGAKAIVDLTLDAVSGGDTTIAYQANAVSGAADVQNLTLRGVHDFNNGAASSVTINNGIETLNVTTADDLSRLVAINTNASTINIAGDQNLSVANLLAGARTINAADFTGDLTIATDSGNLAVAVTGGAGDDFVDFSAGFNAGDSFDGGEGTDTIGLTQQVASGNLGGTLANVEQLQVTDLGNGAIDLAKFGGITKVTYAAGLNGAATLNNAVSGLTVDVAETAGNDLRIDLATDGADDELSVNFKISNGAGQDVGTLDADDAETLNVAVTDSTANKTGKLTINNLQAQDATKIVLSGDSAVTIVGTNDPATPVLAAFDASNLTKGVSLSNTDFAASGATITLGAGNDVYNVANASGADTITLGEGKDTVVYSDVAQSSGAKVDTITDFKSGEDKLDLSALTLGGGITSASQFVGSYANFGAAQGALVGNNTTSATFDNSTNTLWVDVDGNGTLDSNDLQIVLTGVTNLTGADLSLTSGVTFTANKAAFDTSVAADSVENKAVTVFADTINATVAQLAGATIDGDRGDNVLNVTGTNAAGEIADLTATNTFQNVQVVNLAANVEGLKVQTGNLTDVTKINGVAGTTQSLTTEGVVDISTKTLSNIETLNVGGLVSTTTLTAAQHNAFTTINGTTATDHLVVTTAATLTAADSIESYTIAAGSTLTVGTTANGLARNVTESQAAAGISTLVLGAGAYTGTYANFGADDIVKVVNGTDISGITGLANNSTVDFQNADAVLTVNDGQNGALAFTNTNGIQTVAVTGAADTFNVADGIENYAVVGGSEVTVTATNTAVNISGGNAGGTTVNVGGNTVTGTYALSDNNVSDAITATDGADITGVNGGAATTAEVLNLSGGLTLTAAQLAGFTNVTGATANDTINVNNAAGVFTAFATIENYNLVGGSDLSTVTGGTNVTTTNVAGSIIGVSGNVTGTYALAHANDKIVAANGTNLSGVNGGAATTAETLEFANNGSVTVTAAQRAAFAQFIATGTNTLNVTTVDTLSVVAGIETYGLVGGSDVTVTADNLNVNLNADNTGATTVRVGNLAVTGAYALAGLNDRIIATAGADLRGINNGLATSAEHLNISGGVTLTSAQLDAFTSLTGSVGNDTVTVTDSAIANFDVAVGTNIENYSLIGGSSVIVGANAVNITTTNAAASQIIIGGNTVSGTYALGGTFAAGTLDVIVATDGANIVGINNGGASTAETLNLTGGITLTDAQLKGFSNITTASFNGNDRITVVDAGDHGVANKGVENWTLASNGSDKIEFVIGDNEVAAQGYSPVTVDISAGGSDTIVINNEGIQNRTSNHKFVQITGFEQANDKLSIELNGTDVVDTNVALVSGATDGQVVNFTNQGVVRFEDATVVVDDGSGATSYMSNAYLSTVLGGLHATVGSTVTAIVNTAGGQAAIYQVETTVYDTVNGVYDSNIELIGLVSGTGATQLDLSNFI
ncbi:MAG: DUF4214 domain-containing protein [Pseudochelatococcus sp.]|jgi:hypothetical protein|uniref:DUF4214 domain-containing protein n=1 Tax=Pseudochelatococcus sp. TaxID=2020869 RepID=UPI003D8CBE08